MIASGRPLREVLAALCRLFEGSAPDCYCGIYPIDCRGKTFQFGVAPSLPASYTAPIEGVPVGSDNSPRGQSISEKTQVIAQDIGSDLVGWMPHAAPTCWSMGSKRFGAPRFARGRIGYRHCLRLPAKAGQSVAAPQGNDCACGASREHRDRAFTG